MSVIATALRHMLAAGMDHEAIIAAVEAMEGAQPQASSLSPKEKRSERNRRYHEKKRLKASELDGKTSDRLTSDASDGPLPFEVSPEPPSYKPSPEPTPFTPLKGGVSPSQRKDLVEAIFALQPVVGGKRRSGRPDVDKALKAALSRGGDPDEILPALRAYYALPASREDGGKFASGAAVMLNADRWRDFLPAGAGPSLLTVVPKFDGPPELRAWIVAETSEGFAASYVDTATWNKPHRLLIARNAICAGKLKTEAEAPLLRGKVRVVTPEEAQAIVQSEGKAA